MRSSTVDTAVGSMRTTTGVVEVWSSIVIEVAVFGTSIERTDWATCAAVMPTMIALLNFACTRASDAAAASRWASEWTKIIGRYWSPTSQNCR